MSDNRITRDYPYPIDEVWAVLTDPEYVARWTTTGQGGRPEGFAPVPGTSFRFVGKPTMGWAGVVYCEVTDVDAPRMLAYTWKGDEDTDDVTKVTYRMEEIADGTRFTWDHIAHSPNCSIAKAQRLLGYTPRYSSLEAVQEAVSAMQTTGSA